MEHRISYSAIGAFVILLGGVLAILLIWLAAGGAQPSYNTYAIYLKSGAETLARSSSVFYHGVPVGNVLSVSLNPAHPQSAQVLVGVRDGLVLRKDVEATVQARLTGPSYIELTGGSRSAPPLTVKPGEEYPIIPVTPGTVDVLLSSARQIARNLEKVSNRLQVILSDKNVVAITESLTNIHHMTEKLSQYTDEFGSIVTNLNATLVNARAASSRLPALVASVQAALSKYDALAEKASAAAVGVTSAAHRLGTLAPNARGLLSQLNEVSENLNVLVQELQRHPNSVLFGKPVEPGPGESKPPGG
ncbi:MAG: MlaD family protein [Gammaproteobacteria bacterium]|nr:MlaD family protein [Gammaproteobacteria bacterium]